MLAPLLGVSALPGFRGSGRGADEGEPLSRGRQPSVGGCYPACAYCEEEVRTTAFLLFPGVLASAELGFLFAVAKATDKGLEITRARS